MKPIGILGDRQPGNPTHDATDAALAHCGAREVEWVPTDRVGDLSRYGGLLIAPGSPYVDMDGVLRAITHARTSDVPVLGTCGGFQHVIIEFARSVLHEHDAQHAEADPGASTLFVTPLECDIGGQEMNVQLLDGSLARRAYGRSTATERYYCRFGLNPCYRSALEAAGMVVSGTDDQGSVRIVELPALRFFVATLFVPQSSSSPQAPHPLVAAFARATHDDGRPTT